VGAEVGRQPSFPDYTQIKRYPPEPQALPANQPMGGPPQVKGKPLRGGAGAPPLTWGPGPPKPPEMREGLGGKWPGVRGSKARPYRNLNKDSPIAIQSLQPRDF
jgi:hypothetical protein